MSFYHRAYINGKCGGKFGVWRVGFHEYDTIEQAIAQSQEYYTQCEGDYSDVQTTTERVELHRSVEALADRFDVYRIETTATSNADGSRVCDEMFAGIRRED